MKLRPGVQRQSPQCFEAAGGKLRRTPFFNVGHGWACASVQEVKQTTVTVKALMICHGRAPKLCKGASPSCHAVRQTVRAGPGASKRGRKGGWGKGTAAIAVTGRSRGRSAEGRQPHTGLGSGCVLLARPAESTQSVAEGCESHTGRAAARCGRSACHARGPKRAAAARTGEPQGLGGHEQPLWSAAARRSGCAAPPPRRAANHCCGGVTRWPWMTWRARSLRCPHQIEGRWSWPPT